MRTSPKAKRFHRWKLLTGALSLTLEFAFFAALSITGLSSAMAGWAGALGWGGRWVQAALFTAILVAISAAVFFPPSFAGGYLLEKKHGLLRQSLGAWLRDHAKVLALNGLLMIAAVEILYGFIWLGGDLWWIWAGFAYCALFVVIARLAPTFVFPLFFKFTPIEDEDLLHRLRRLADRAETSVAGVFEMDLSRKSSTANAALAGLGRSRRIVLADTLIRRFTHDEIEVVIAHELGHHLQKHLIQGIAIRVAMIFAFLWLVDSLAGQWTIRCGFEGLGDIAALPVLALSAVALGAIVAPFLNFILRHFERQADRYAIEATAKPESFVSAMRRLASFNMADPSPNPLVEFLFHSHPSIERRIAFCEGVMGDKTEEEPLPE